MGRGLRNLVTTAGKHDMLDKYLAGSASSGAFYMGLISSVSYTAVAAADTMSSHADWTEAGIANAPTSCCEGARSSVLPILMPLLQHHQHPHHCAVVSGMLFEMLT
jgi:hypothetical protein